MNGSAPTASGQGVLPLESWGQPPRRQPGPAAAPVLAVDGFEEPLDWLLDLARTRRIDLARLSIVALVEAFTKALAAAFATPDLRPTLLGRWGDWLVMAADLTLLRSRLLMPADAAAAQDAQDEAERLRQRLLGRAEIGLAADWLEGRVQLSRDVFARGKADGAGVVRAGRTGDVTALLRACLVAIRLPAEAGALYRVPGPLFWSVADAAARIRAMLPGGRRGGPRVRGLSARGADGRSRAGAAMPGRGGGDLPGRARTDARRKHHYPAAGGLDAHRTQATAGITIGIRPYDAAPWRHAAGRTAQSLELVFGSATTCLRSECVTCNYSRRSLKNG